MLVAVQDALATDDTAQADRLLSAWKQAARRARDLVALEAAAAREQAAGTGDGTEASVDADLTDEELCSHLERLTPESFRRWRFGRGEEGERLSPSKKSCAVRGLGRTTTKNRHVYVPDFVRKSKIIAEKRQMLIEKR